MPGPLVALPYLPYNVTVPPGTLETAPQATVVNLGLATLLDIRLLIPRGTSGLVGWGLDLAGQRVIPYGDKHTWIIGDDERLLLDCGFDVSGPLSIRTYNLDVYPHTLYALFHADLLTGTGSAAGVALAPL